MAKLGINEAALPAWAQACTEAAAKGAGKPKMPPEVRRRVTLRRGSSSMLAAVKALHIVAL